ncbi:MAG: O-antigen ligase family protein [Flavobacterium sp.]
METIFHSLNNAWQLLLRESKANPGLPFLIILSCSIPMGFAISNIAMVLFFGASFLSLRNQKLKLERYFLVPIVLFIWIVISIIWTEDYSKTLRGITKMLPFLLLPLPFLMGYSITKLQRDFLLKCYAYSMFGFAIFYLLKAIFRFFISGNIDVFFYHELVTFELNAIYVSVFFVLAFFILLQQKKSFINTVGCFTLLILLLLLSSKNAVVVFGLLFLVYMFRNRDRIVLNSKMRWIGIVSIVLILAASIHFTKRYSDEITVQRSKFENPQKDSVNPDGTHNVSLYEAWNNEKFTQNDYFTGISLRVYLVRVFKEMVQERDRWYLGTGYYATDNYLEKSVEQKGMYPEYNRFNFHNQYIQIFAELGILGFALLILLLFRTLYISLKTKDFTTFVFSILMISLFLTESFFHRQRGVLFFVLFYCVLYVKKEVRPQK